MLVTNSLLDPKLTLASIVFLLGIRHGFEIDHLAVIDGMVSSLSTSSKFSKWVGFLFALGHGLIIVLLTILIAVEAYKWNIPDWLEAFGIWISILFLIFFGLYSLYITFKKSQQGIRNALGPKSFLFNKYRMQMANATFLTPIFVGMLFSLSFDTLSVTAAFSLNGYALGGSAFPVLLGIMFMLGMMTTDGLNGYFIACLLSHSDKRPQLVSRVLDIVIGGFSLAVGSFYLVSHLVN